MVKQEPVEIKIPSSSLPRSDQENPVTRPRLPRIVKQESVEIETSLPSLPIRPSSNEENIMPLEHKLVPYLCDQRDLFADLEVEQERLCEYQPSERFQHYPADIGEIIEYKRQKTRYQILRKMGFGNFSLAWLAEENKQGRKSFVALKIFKSGAQTTAKELDVCF